MEAYILSGRFCGLPQHFRMLCETGHDAAWPLYST